MSKSIVEGCEHLFLGVYFSVSFLSPSLPFVPSVAGISLSPPFNPNFLLILPQYQHKISGKCVKYYFFDQKNMTNTNLDESGVPILSTDAIEIKAEEVISYFDKKILEVPQRTPLLEYVEKLHSRYNLIRNYNQSLGRTKNGSAILGKTQLKPLGLFVDASLVNDPRFNFVLGHELGHVVLHRSVDIKRTGYEDQDIVDTEIDFVTGKKILRTPRDWLEWQANYFSSSILMPRISVVTAVVTKQNELGIKKHLGRIILEPKAYSLRDYKAVQKHLELVYSVNSTNVECRLNDLGILINRMNLNVQHVSELFSTE